MKRLNENDMSQYLLDKVYLAAEEIYANEISDNVPDLTFDHRPSPEYLQRFDYLSDNLKNAVKRAAVKLSRDFENDGISINIWNIENELYDALKCFSK